MSVSAGSTVGASPVVSWNTGVASPSTSRKSTRVACATPDRYAAASDVLATPTKSSSPSVALARTATSPSSDCGTTSPPSRSRC